MLANLFFRLLCQPLMDNLESQTYEVFEKDPIKYSQYQQVWCWLQHGKAQGQGKVGKEGVTAMRCSLSPQAIYKCLLDRVPEEEKETNVQ